jgi:hypothetical protein
MSFIKQSSLSFCSDCFRVIALKKSERVKVWSHRGPMGSPISCRQSKKVTRSGLCQDNRLDGIGMTARQVGADRHRRITPRC